MLPKLLLSNIMNSWLEYKLEAAETFVCRMYGLEHVVAAEKSRCIFAASFYTRQNVSKLDAFRRG